MRPSRRSSHLTSVAVTAVALVLAACGGGTEPAAPAAPPAAAPATPTDPVPDAPAGVCEGVDRQRIEIGIASAPPGSAAFLVAGLASEWVRQASGTDYVTMSAEATGGLVENLFLVERGESLAGWGSSWQMREAMLGEAAFAQNGPFSELRAAFPVFESVWHVVTFDPSIQNLSDLAGKRVNIGTPGGSNAQYAEAAFTAVGIWDTLRLERQADRDAVSLMQDGQIDAMTVIGPAPFPPIQEAAAAPGRTLNFVSVAEAIAGDVFSLQPGMSPISFPANVYGAGLPSDEYVGFGHIVYFVTSEQVPDCVMYDLMTELLSEEGGTFLSDGYAPVGTALTRLPGFGPVENAGVKLHPGAVLYWEERGETIPDSIRP